MHVSPFFCMQADYVNSLVRHIIISSGLVSTFAGQAGITGSTNGIGTNAIMARPVAIALDAAGTFALVVSISIFCVFVHMLGLRL